MNRRIVHALSIASLVFALALVPSALAAKGGGHNGATTSSSAVSLVVVDSPANDNLPHFGGAVTYAVATTATLSPWVYTSCFQGTTQVLSTSAGYFASYPTDARSVPLNTMLWTGGAADCTAQLYSMDGGKQTTLATLSFHVDA